MLHPCRYKRLHADVKHLLDMCSSSLSGLFPKKKHLCEIASYSFRSLPLKVNSYIFHDFVLNNCDMKYPGDNRQSGQH